MGEGVRAFGVEQGLTPGDAALLELAVVEAVNNAILHAYAGIDQGQVRVDMTRQGNRLIFAVTDWGQPFDLASQMARARERNQSPDLAEHGRGLALINQIMDQVEYSSQGGANTMRLTKLEATA